MAAQAGPGLHLVVQVLADLVEGAAGSPQLDALGHDGAFALVDDLDVDVLARAASRSASPSASRTPAQRQYFSPRCLRAWSPSRVRTLISLRS